MVPTGSELEVKGKLGDNNLEVEEVDGIHVLELGWVLVSQASPNLEIEFTRAMFGLLPAFE